MYILLALIGACVLGIAAHYLIGARELRGVAVTPATATAAAGATYTLMQWLGVSQDSVWLWVASVVGAVLFAVLVTLVLVAVRRRSDAVARAKLGL